MGLEVSFYTMAVWLLQSDIKICKECKEYQEGRNAGKGGYQEGRGVPRGERRNVER